MKKGQIVGLGFSAGERQPSVYCHWVRPVIVVVHVGNLWRIGVMRDLLLLYEALLKKYDLKSLAPQTPGIFCLMR